MPLTPAHAAAALPLAAVARRAKFPLPFSAIVIGTMAPDFEYLLRLAPVGGFAHSPQGLIVFCLPVGVFAWLIWRMLVAPELLGIAPPGVRAELRDDMQRVTTLRAIPAAAVAVVLGAISHDVWDAFTHDHGWGLTYWPALQSVVAPELAPSLRWFKLLQHGSTAVGLAWIAWAVARWIRSRPPEARRFAPGAARRSAAIAGAILVAGVLGAALNLLRGQPSELRDFLGLAAVGGMDGLALGAVVAALAARTRVGSIADSPARRRPDAPLKSPRAPGRPRP